MPLHLATFFYDPDPSVGHEPRTFVAMMLGGSSWASEGTTAR
ncbi:hypothetical protein BH20ACT18_BH20ACT18_09340 [soil metagenome]